MNGFSSSFVCTLDHLCWLQTLSCFIVLSVNVPQQHVVLLISKLQINVIRGERDAASMKRQSHVIVYVLIESGSCQ
jgi:hypothetical protein